MRAALGTEDAALATAGSGLAAPIPAETPPDDPFAGLPGERLRYWLARALGLRLISDVHERAVDFGLALPPGRRRSARLAMIRRAGALFIHIPKNAGQSVSAALYGGQIQHATIRYYARVAPDIARLPSFAVLRDPVERFASAFHYGRMGGAPDNRITPAFQDICRSFRSIDDALDHVERAPNPYQLDHIFRPQAWYVTDASGALAVDRLFDFRDLAGVAAAIPQLGAAPIGHVNRGGGEHIAMRPDQTERVRALYAQDYALIPSPSILTLAV